MTHFTPKFHFVADVRHFIGSLHHSGIARKLHLFSSASKDGGQSELSAHLRYDTGEDDMRPAVRRSLLQQEAARANALETMLLRSF